MPSAIAENTSGMTIIRSALMKAWASGSSDLPRSGKMSPRMQPTTRPASICSGKVRCQRERAGSVGTMSPGKAVAVIGLPPRYSTVMPAHAGIHVFRKRQQNKTWMAGTGPAMTEKSLRRLARRRMHAAAPAQPLLAQPHHLVDVVAVVVDVEREPQQVAPDGEPHAGRREMLIQIRHVEILRRVVRLAERLAHRDDVRAVRARPAAVDRQADIEHALDEMSRQREHVVLDGARPELEQQLERGRDRDRSREVGVADVEAHRSRREAQARRVAEARLVSVMRHAIA